MEKKIVGTVWMQRILTLIYDEDFPELRDAPTYMWMPWLENRPIPNTTYETRRSPRLFSSHLQEHLMPRGLLRKKAKVSETLHVHGTHIHIQCMCV